MMTREEAIKALRLERGIEINGNAVRVAEFLQGLDVAISALRPVSREQVEKVWRGEWKRRNTKNGIEWFCSKCGYVSTPRNQCRDFIPFPENRPMLFCNACGAPMTDEAVEMVMERWEALTNVKTD